MKVSFKEYCVRRGKEEMLAQWDDEANALPPEQVPSSSRQPVAWKCEYGHKWTLPPAWRTRCKYTDCPYCAHRRASAEYNLAALYPKHAKLWDYEKNDRRPEELLPNASRDFWWRCEKGHAWKQKPNQQIYTKGCPFCNGKRVSEEYNLKVLFPQVAKEWDNEKNELKPEQVHPYSGKKAAWVCGFNPTHKWEAVVGNRTKHTHGCPICRRQRKTSFPEQAIFYYLKKLFADCENKAELDGWEIDVMLPGLKLGIEYNGVFHEIYDRAGYDAQKREYLQKAGIDLLTVKEDSQLDGMAVLQGQFITCRVDSGYRYLNKVIPMIVGYINKKYGLDKQADVDVKRDAHYIRTLYVDGRKADSLAERYPHLAAEWHKEANWPITPEMVAYGSGAEYVWRCKKGHVWKTSANKRTNRNSKCPFCTGHRVSDDNRLSRVKPAVAKMWDKERNGKLTAAEVSVGSHKVVHWKCEKGHRWQRVVKEMVESGRCPYCSGRRIIKENSLAAKHPHLLAQWDFDKNEMSPWKTAPATNKYAWWVCGKGHSWRAKICNRSVLDRGCPYCAKKLATEEENFAVLFPHLAAEWHHGKNGGLKPEDVRPKSNKRVWWLCPRGHEWEGSIYGRVAGCKCPHCRTRYVRDNCLADKYPEVAARWHPEKNGELLPQNFSAKSGQMVWWRCGEHPHHEWRRRIAHEVESKNGCPYCAGYRVCKENSLAAQFPQLVKEWDYVANGAQQPHDFTYGSNKVVGWICEERHRWKASIVSRTKKGKKCPHCEKVAKRG